MSAHHDDALDAQARGLDWPLRPAIWLALTIVLADFLAVGDSLWWHALGATSHSPHWRRLPNLFVNSWNEGVERSNFDVLRLALASSQASLLALWACLGRRRWALRWSAAAAGIGYCITVLVAGSASAYNATQAEVLFATQAISIVVLTTGLRILGWRLSSASSYTGAPRAFWRRMQFTMHDLIAGTAVVAALMWVWPNLLVENTIDDLQRAIGYRGTGLQYGDPRPQLVWMAASGMLCGAVAALGAWLLLRAGRLWLRLIVFGLASWAAARIMILGFVDFNIYMRERITAYTEPHPEAPYVAWICLQAAISALALMALRWDGRRLDKRGGAAGATQQAPANRPNSVVWSLLGGGAFLLLVSSAAVFDDVVSWIAGDRELRRTAAAVNSQFGGKVSVFCFYPNAYDWRHRGRPAVGARLTSSIDVTALESLRAAHTIEGLWLDSEISLATWQEILRFPNLKLLCLRTDSQSAQTTDQELKQLATLMHVQHLELTSADISDEGLMYLASFPNLMSVHLKCPRITKEGEAEFRRLRPRTWLHCER